jgi:excisionase family DNA binding protein
MGESMNIPLESQRVPLSRSDPRLAQDANSIHSQPERPRASSPLTSPWLTYIEAAAYTGWSVAYLRNLVSAGQIPVYGKPRVRRFRRDMLDVFLTDPDAAMRRFRAERNRHGS